MYQFFLNLIFLNTFYCDVLCSIFNCVFFEWSCFIFCQGKHVFSFSFDGNGWPPLKLLNIIYHFCFFGLQIGVFLLLQQFSINLNLIHYVEQPRILRQFRRKQTLNMLAGCWIVLESLVWSQSLCCSGHLCQPSRSKT